MIPAIHEVFTCRQTDGLRPDPDKEVERIENKSAVEAKKERSAAK